MRQSIRALGWASKILLIATAAFVVTSLYTPLKLMLEGQMGIGWPPKLSFSNGTITAFVPFFINNTGFYDISDLNLTTSAIDNIGTLISTSTTSVENIRKGGIINETHAMSTSIDDVISKNLTYLLLDDAIITLEMSVGLKIAGVIPLQVSTGANMSWGAPFYSPSMILVGLPAPYNSTHYSMTGRLSFENHSPFDIEGTMRLETFNERKELLGIWIGQINAPSGGEYNERTTIYIPTVSISRFSGRGEVHAYFESPMGNLDWWFSYG